MSLKLPSPVKWILIGIGGFAGLIALILGIIFQLTSGMTKVADNFLVALKDGNTKAALSLLSEQARSDLSEENIRSFTRKNSLTAYKGAFWSNRSINYPNRGELIGTVELETGQTIDLTFTFQKNDEAWQIYSIQQDSPGIHSQQSSTQMPAEAYLIQLVNDTTKVFVKSIKQGNFKSLHKFSSGTWREEMTVEQFDKALAPFLKFTSNPNAIEYFDRVSKGVPVFDDQPQISADGILKIVGSYKSDPNLNFEYSYIYEGLGWKLVGVDVKV